MLFRNSAQELGKYGLLYYNCLFMLAPMVALCVYLGEFERVQSFAGWSEPGFVVAYLSSCVMGFVLMYSTVLCTSYNSALTTTIVGCLKVRCAASLFRPETLNIF